LTIHSKQNKDTFKCKPYLTFSHVPVSLKVFQGDRYSIILWFPWRRVLACHTAATTAERSDSDCQICASGCVLLLKHLCCYAQRILGILYVHWNLPPSAQFDIIIIMILFFVLLWSLQSDKMNQSTTNVSPQFSQFLNFMLLEAI